MSEFEYRLWCLWQRVSRFACCGLLGTHSWDDDGIMVFSSITHHVTQGYDCCKRCGVVRFSLAMRVPIHTEDLAQVPGTAPADPKEEEPMKTKNKKAQPGDRVEVRKVGA